ncbi:hypothetical protein Tco_0891545 [Tanacetum coccineum]|uniref:Uncharacterized protein n=1 Tax=Tanacetum coccineum TaxID=301880 RepID=A0ABQ5C4R5_9ASTR
MLLHSLRLIEFAVSKNTKHKGRYRLYNSCNYILKEDAYRLFNCCNYTLKEAASTKSYSLKQNIITRFSSFKLGVLRVNYTSSFCDVSDDGQLVSGGRMRSQDVQRTPSTNKLSEVASQRQLINLLNAQCFIILHNVEASRSKEPNQLPISEPRVT